MPARTTSNTGQVKSLPALTGIRGVAAAWVVFSHTSHALGHLAGVEDLQKLPFLRDGYLGVDIFFILSGFILSHVYATSFQKWNYREYFYFLLIRLARIYPLHLFALCVFALIVFVLPGFTANYAPDYFSRHNFVFSALLLQNFLHNPVIWNGPAWTLSAEFLAYLCFPALLMICRNVQRGTTALLCAGLSLGLLTAVFLKTGRSMDVSGLKAGFLRLACEFTAGCLLQRAYASGDSKPSGSRLATLAAFALILAGLLNPAWTPLCIVPFGWLILTVADSDSFAGKFLSNPVVVFSGEVSFSLYLTHSIVLHMVEYAVNRYSPEVMWRIITALLLVAALTVIPLLTWKYIEKPARGIGRKLAARMLFA